MSREKNKKKLFIYFIFYVFLHIVDFFRPPLHLADMAAPFKEEKSGTKRDSFWRDYESGTKKGITGGGVLS